MGILAYSKDLTLFNAITTTTFSTYSTAYVEGLGFVVVQVSTLNTTNGGGRIYWQGSQDGVNWYGVRLTDMNSGTASTATTADSLFQGDIRGLSWFRGNLSSFTFGATTVTAIACFTGPSA